MERASTSGVLVGVDGSADALRAALWAAREAMRRGVRLTVATVRRATRPSTDVDDDRYLEEQTTREAVEAADTAAAVAAEIGCGVDTVVTAGHPAAVLSELAQGASVVYVGSRGRGGFGRLVLGSVSDQLARHALCPVVVVREKEPSGPVIVGIDLGVDSEVVLGFAVETAAARGARLLALHATPSPPGYIPSSGSPRDLWPKEQLHHAGEALAHVVEPWAGKYPELGIEPIVMRGAAAESLVDASHTAALVVVGATGSGGFAGLRMGSVGIHLLHYAECSVAIVRP